MREFQPGQEILDYRYKGGRKIAGDEVEWLTQAQFRSRYPPEEGMPEGRGTHVLSSGGRNPTYYDTARSGGVGGKANTKQGACNVEFDPGMKMVATRKIEPGEEIFADYGPGYSWEEYDGEREGWTFARRRGGREAREVEDIGNLG